MKETSALLFFFVLRQLERVFSVELLYLMLKPVAFVRAFVRDGFKKTPPPMTLPECFNSRGTVHTAKLHRMDLYLNRALQFFPDRLATAKWLNRCHINGIEHVLATQRSGRPVILAFCHFGPFYLARFWLCAAGIRATTLIGGKSKNESLLKRLRDRRSPFSGMPTTFYRDQLRELSAFLAAGNALAMAIDYPAGKQINVPVRDGWDFQMATGAIRLAIHHQAELIPCCIIDEGRWRFRIELGRPVPKEHLAAEKDLIPAGKHLLAEMLVHFENHPDQCPDYLLKHFRQSSAAVSPEK